MGIQSVWSVWGGFIWLVGRSFGGNRLVWEEDAEGGSPNWIALCPDAPRVLHDDGAADGQAQPGAAFLAGVGGVDLLEAAEDGLELVGGDSAALIDDRERDAVGAGPQHDGDCGAWRRKLDGVGEQVGEHLKQAIGVGGDLNFGGVVDELHAGCLGHGGHAIDGLAHDLASLTGRKARGSRPLWMRSRSRMSLMSRTRRSELVRAMRSRLAALSFSSPRMPEESRPSAPRMEVSGVRSSWLTVEMNSSLSRSRA